MRSEKIVQFVCFETPLEYDQFLTQWEQYDRSVNSDLDVTLHQSERNGIFRYIGEHRCANAELQFFFTKAKRSSRIPEVQIKVKQVGGYSVLQSERTGDAASDEVKVFVFVSDPTTDLAAYRQLGDHSKLNIYEAYYENCQYAYVLEYYVKSKFSAALVEHLKTLNSEDAWTYKECLLQAS